MRVSPAAYWIGAALVIFACGGANAEPIPTLYNTGMSDAVTQLPDNAVDPHYILTEVPAGLGLGPDTYVVDSTLYPIATEEWMAGNATSKWISVLSDQTTLSNDPGAGNYLFRTTFDLSGFDPASAQLSGQWTVDNFGLDIFINGVSTENSHTDQSELPIYLVFKNFSITTGFVSGLNTLDFLVRNEPFEGAINPMGLRVELSGTANLIVEPPNPYGDFNHDGFVDAADYVVWRDGLGGPYKPADYDVWKTHFGQSVGDGSSAAGYPLGASAAPQSPAVPEPSTFALATVGAFGWFASWGRRATKMNSRTH